MIQRYFTIGIIFLFITSGVSVATHDFDIGFMKRGDTLFIGGSRIDNIIYYPGVYSTNSKDKCS